MSPDAFDRVHDLGSTDLGPPLSTGMTAYFVSNSLTVLELWKLLAHILTILLLRESPMSVRSRTAIQ
jgi:hypothetical protein